MQRSSEVFNIRALTKKPASRKCKRIQRDSTKPAQQQTIHESQENGQIAHDKGTQKSSELSENDKETLGDAKGIINRRKCSTKLNIKAKIIKLRDYLLTNSEASFKCSMKKRRCSKDTTLKRRSKYIGVSKNNTHWQAFITVKRVKRYIGIFFDELEAARTYDLYAVAMKWKSAFLNFNYIWYKMLEVINFYLAQGRVNMELPYGKSTQATIMYPLNIQLHFWLINLGINRIF
ncbi:unnamed protein product [Moneuplotes crassus]|uniref:AP2/ERF domain-containing protein n=1 Tax=Euplotes crassus TaxID=5936 RepID=A0AAD1Y483_EUPCR|nr:unnamed protein product [Moneuplotes crassus]